MKKYFLTLILLLLIICGSIKKEPLLISKENNSNLAIYLEGEKVQTIPTNEEEYYFDEEKSNCTNDSNIKWDYEMWGPIISNLSQTKTKCHLYFKKSLIEKGKESLFNYTGSSQEFVVPTAGFYKIELWGASGGENEKSIGGKGGYTSGTIFLKEKEKLYLYIGEKGKFAKDYKESLDKTFNGGGAGTINDGCKFGSGGGATDIRLTNGTWDNIESLKSRIMVAAGGGAGVVCDAPHYDNLNIKESNGASAGGINGYNGIVLQTALDDRFVNHNSPFGGTQTLGGTISSNKTYIGTFGKAGITGNSSSGGGGGYYGGEGGYDKSYSPSGGGGGSSFISGHKGCDAINESSTISNITHTGQEVHYSSHVFKNTVMIDGAGYLWENEKKEYVGMPTFDGKDKMIGNENNGYAKITYLGVSSIKKE